ncbi:unnamed protein product [Thlaspi arvense]|uniref:TF-B3 domain-containing protein n=1 Tax=Thlaspi arvense TaxID=13288 RepID=A0AAU9T1R1_THLAR|nr:unnamed protein product [Thlaspi arvense]
MADPLNFSLFHHKFLTGAKPNLTFEDEFLRRHTKVLLRSDASDRIWEVKLDGNRLAGGWEKFAAVHKFRDGDVLVFRHEGDENFHVAVSSRSNSGDIQNASHSYDVDTDVTEIDDDDVESDDGEGEDDDDEVGGEDDAGKVFDVHHISDMCFNFRDLPRDFTFVSFDKHNKPGEIDLANGQGRKWTLLLAKNSSSGVFYIRRGWVNFCSANKLRKDDLCVFKVSENGERPVLRLCPQDSGNGHEKKKRSVDDDASKGKEKNSPSSFLTVKLTSSRFKTGILVSSRTFSLMGILGVYIAGSTTLLIESWFQYISSVFVTESGIKKTGEITLLNEDGRKWSSYLQMTGRCGSEWFYLRNGWREMCQANGVRVNDSFELELIWENENPMFKFVSKIENRGKGNRGTRKKRACETPLQLRSAEKTPSVETEGRRASKKGRTGVSNRANTNSRKLRRTQPNSCSISDQVTNVKQSILDTLNAVRHFRAGLEMRETNLEAALLEIDALGEKILGISQIINSNPV